MKLYYIGIFDDNEPQHGLRRALSTFGVYIEDSWPQGIIKMGKPAFWRYVQGRAAALKPDVIFFQLQTPDTLPIEILKKLPGFKINWTGDVRHPLPNWYIDSGKYFDLTLFSNYTDVKDARKKHIAADYLQTSADEHWYNANGPKHLKGPAIIYMGNHYPGSFPLSRLRYDMCKRLKDVYGTHFGIYGANMDELGAVNTMFNHQYCAALYRNSKIAINLSHYNYERYSSDRMYRIMLTGAFCLSHHYKAIEKDFEPGVHLDTWKTLDELQNKIEYYLGHEKERQKIAAAGLKHILKFHTWAYRMKELKELIKKYT